VNIFFIWRLFNSTWKELFLCIVISYDVLIPLHLQLMNMLVDDVC